MNILITGSNGYVGKLLIDHLVGLKNSNNNDSVNTIVAADIRHPEASERHEAVIYEELDITSNKVEETLIKHNTNAIIHLAAVVDAGKKPNRERAYNIDVNGTKNLLDACIKAKVDRFIVTSSGAAYGYHPDHPTWITESEPLRGNYEFFYAHHKMLVEELLAKYRLSNPELKQFIFRVGTVIGEKTQNQITNLFDKNSVLKVRGYKSPFVFIWDNDLVRILNQALKSSNPGIFNVAGDGCMSPTELAEFMGKKCISVPAGVLKFVLGVLRKLGLSPYGPEQVMFLQYRPVLLNTKLKEVFGYSPQKTSKEAFIYFWTNRKTIEKYSS